MDGTDEPIVPRDQTGYWLRILGVALLVVILAVVLFYLNDRNLGKTVVPPTHGGHGLSPQGAKPTTDPNLK